MYRMCRLFRIKSIEFSHKVKEKIWRIKWFKFKRDKNRFVGLISCVDGKLWHGGLCDRFKGIVSTYLYCKLHNLSFKIKYTYPFDLKDYLVPNEYDWELQPDEFSNSFFNCKVMYLVGEATSKRIKSPGQYQLHVYANRDSTKYQDPESNWGELFKELFKPSPKLLNALNELQFGVYIALVFRFQNLFGDFNEYGFKELPDNEKQLLLSRCMEAVSKISAKTPTLNVLVTSDSITFLQAVSKLEKVKIIPGNLTHIDNHNNHGSDSTFLKSFVDFYMISRAQKVYCIGTKEMYPSEFPMYAAKLNNVDFERIIIE